MHSSRLQKSYRFRASLATPLSTSKVASAHLSQRYCWARSSPLAFSSFCSSEESATLQRDLLHSSAGLRGSKVIPAVLMSSLSEELLDAITGHPAAMASRTGKPNPSYKEGN